MAGSYNKTIGQNCINYYGENSKFIEGYRAVA